MITPFQALVLGLFLLYICISDGSSLFGFVTDSAAVISSSGALQVNGVTIREDFQYIRQYSDSFIGLQGDCSDCEYMFSMIDGYTRDYSLGNDNRYLSCKALSHVCRNIIARRIRNRPLDVNGIVAGWDHVANKPCLYWFDSYGSLQRVSHAAHGSDFMFILSHLDYLLPSVTSKKINARNHIFKEFDKNAEEKICDIIRGCWSSVQKRGPRTLGKIHAKIVSSSTVLSHDISIQLAGANAL